MTVEVYLGEKFAFDHELASLQVIYQDLVTALPLNELCLMIVEAEIETAAVDLLLVHGSGFCLVELKHLTHPLAKYSPPELSGKENGPWQYRIGSGKPLQVGGSHNNGNPYLQVKRMRYKVGDWLRKHLHSDLQPLRDSPLEYISAWAVFDPPVRYTRASLDLPWPTINKWFRVCSLPDVASEIWAEFQHRHALTARQMRKIPEALGTPRCQDLSEFLKVHLPDAIFPPLPALVDPIGREKECAELTRWLETSSLSVVAIYGVPGAGKGTLARWVAGEASTAGYECYWLDARRNPQITQTQLLDALTRQAPLEVQAALRLPSATPTDLRNQHYETPLEQALSFAAKRPTLIVMDDFQLIAYQPGLREFVAEVFRFPQVRLVLVQTTWPDPVDWPPGHYRLLAVPRLVLEAFTLLVKQRHPVGKLNDADLAELHRRISGNLHLITRNWAMIEEYALQGRVNELPLYDSDAGREWHRRIISLLPAQAAMFAETLSATQGILTRSLLEEMAGVGSHDLTHLIGDLMRLYLLEQVASSDTWVFETGARDFLYSQLDKQRQLKAHRAAGKAYQAAIGQVALDPWQRQGYAWEALRHHVEAGAHRQVLNQAVILVDDLVQRGDGARAWQAAEHAFHAARALQGGEAQSDIRAWAERLAEISLTEGTYYSDALDAIRLGLENFPSRKHWSARLQQGQDRLQMLSARLQYRTKRYAEAIGLFGQIAQRAQAAKDTLLVAKCHTQMGQAERRQENWSAAEDHFRLGLALAREALDWQVEFDCLCHLGVVARKQGQFSAAKQQYYTAFQLAEQNGDQLAQEITLSHAGRLCEQMGQIPEAEKLLRKALQLARELNNGRGIRIELTRLISALLHLSDMKEIDTLLEESHRLNKVANDEIGLAWGDKFIGQLLCRRGETEKGKAYIRQGLERIRSSFPEHVPEFERALKEC